MTASGTQRRFDDRTGSFLRAVSQHGDRPPGAHSPFGLPPAERVGQHPSRDEKSRPGKRRCGGTITPGSWRSFFCVWPERSPITRSSFAESCFQISTPTRRPSCRRAPLVCSVLQIPLLERRLRTCQFQEEVERDDFEIRSEPVQDALCPLQIAVFPDVDEKEVRALRVDRREFLQISGGVGFGTSLREVVIERDERFPAAPRTYRTGRTR